MTWDSYYNWMHIGKNGVRDDSAELLGFSFIQQVAHCQERDEAVKFQGSGMDSNVMQMKLG